MRKVTKTALLVFLFLFIKLFELVNAWLIERTLHTQQGLQVAVGGFIFILTIFVGNLLLKRYPIVNVKTAVVVILVTLIITTLIKPTLLFIFFFGIFFYLLVGAEALTIQNMQTKLNFNPVVFSIVSLAITIPIYFLYKNGVPYNIAYIAILTVIQSIFSAIVAHSFKGQSTGSAFGDLPSWIGLLFIALSLVMYFTIYQYVLSSEPQGLLPITGFMLSFYCAGAMALLVSLNKYINRVQLDRVTDG